MNSFRVSFVIYFLNIPVFLNALYFNESTNTLKISELFECFCDKHVEKDITAHDLDSIKGYSTDCCGLCLARPECKAWSWTNFNGGTCWLKTANGPMRHGANTILGIVNESFRSCKMPAVPSSPISFVFIIVIIALILIIILYFFCARYSTSRYSNITMLKKLEEAESFVPKGAKTHSDKQQSQATILMSQVKMIKIIGKGNSANVRIAHYRPTIDSLNVAEVAVKTMKTHFCQDVVKKEIEIMRACKHENIVEFIGWAQEGSSIHIVSEFMFGGNLHDYLSDAANRPTIKDCFSYITQILDAMVYLSQAHIVHRDLAARNCLLNSTHELLKISDFGLSRKTDINYEYVSKSAVKLPFRWLPLEAFSSDNRFTTKGDIWAFGVCVWEIFQRGMLPYGNMDMPTMINFLQSGKRLKKPQCCPDQLYAVMQSCWDKNPEARPCFEMLQTQIHNILETYNKENEKNLNKEYEKPVSNSNES